jgi:hypothetical protein
MSAPNYQEIRCPRCDCKLRFDAERQVPAVLLTSEQWQTLFPVRVIDPDGWDRRNFNYSWSEERITLAEYKRRLVVSTIDTAAFRKWLGLWYAEQHYNNG